MSFNIFAFEQISRFDWSVVPVHYKETDSFRELNPIEKMSVLGICLCFRHIYALSLSRFVRWEKRGACRSFTWNFLICK